MRCILAALCVVLASAPAHAHFIYLLPEKDQKFATMVFSDTLGPDDRVAIDKISATKLIARDAAGKPVDVKMTQQKHHYDVNVEGMRPIMVAGTCTYGVLTKKGDPFLLVYHPKTVLMWTEVPTVDPAWLTAGSRELPLEIIQVKTREGGRIGVLFQGKPLAGAAVNLVVADVDEEIGKTDEAGTLDFEAGRKILMKAKHDLMALRVVHTERREGELDGKAYKEVKHYATFAIRPMVKREKKEAKEEEVSFLAGDKKADPAATKLLADARAARALWHKFPGFSATVVINQDGQRIPGRVSVSEGGKVTLKTDLADLSPKQDEIIKKARGEISSLVQHRMPGGPSDTPCAFADGVEDHPQGRLITVLNDELHSSYRIRDRQILEVNRSMGEGKFTITVLENMWNKEKTYLPAHYVVNSWDKAGNLKSSIAHRNTWVRVGAFDLPDSLTTVQAAPGALSVRTLSFTNHKLGAE